MSEKSLKSMENHLNRNFESSIGIFLRHFESQRNHEVSYKKKSVWIWMREERTEIIVQETRTITLNAWRRGGGGAWRVWQPHYLNPSRQIGGEHSPIGTSKKIENDKKCWILSRIGLYCLGWLMNMNNSWLVRLSQEIPIPPTMQCLRNLGHYHWPRNWYFPGKPSLNG